VRVLQWVRLSLWYTRSPTTATTRYGIPAMHIFKGVEAGAHPVTVSFAQLICTCTIGTPAWRAASRLTCNTSLCAMIFSTHTTHGRIAPPTTDNAGARNSLPFHRSFVNLNRSL